MLPTYQEWKNTYATLHRIMQITGKLQLAHTQLLNHHWNVTYFVSPKGLTGQTMTCNGKKYRIDYDFVEHNIVFHCQNSVETLKLESKPMAQYWSDIKAMCEHLGIPFTITDITVELQKNHAFSTDTEHATYNEQQVEGWFAALHDIDEVFNTFRAQFLGKQSPSHFFWGSFDLAITRFNGLPAELKPDADVITKEAYSHQVISAGFWPGEGLGEAAFYAYAAPQPEGFDQGIDVKDAYYHKELGEYVLPYTTDKTDLLAFLEQTYTLGAKLAKWPEGLLRDK